jgi:hypothetical protein
MKRTCQFLGGVLLVVSVCTLFGPEARSAEPAKKKPDLTLLKRLLYAINDQHDTLALALQDAITDQRTNALDKRFDSVSLEQLEKLSREGSTPGAKVLQMRLAVKNEGVQEEVLANKIEALKTKLGSLEALVSGDVRGFLKNDRDTNEAQLHQFEGELEKAQATAKLETHFYEAIHELYEQGRQPWAADHAEELYKLKMDEIVDLWRRKVAEQTKQRDAAQQELDEYDKEHPENGEK